MFGGPLPSSFLRPAASRPAKMRYFRGNYPSDLPTGEIFDSGNFVLVEKLTEVAPGIFLVPTTSKTPGTLELHELPLAIKGSRGLMLMGWLLPRGRRGDSTSGLRDRFAVLHHFWRIASGNHPG